MDNKIPTSSDQSSTPIPLGGGFGSFHAQSTKGIFKFMSDSEKINTLHEKLSLLERSYNYHGHTGYDSTNKLDIQKQKRFSRTKLVDQTTITTDATLGNAFYVTLGGNRTLGNPTGAAPGQRILFELIQDGTGSRTITLGSKFNAGGFTVTLTTTASKRDFLEVFYSDVDDKFYVINFVKNY